MSETTFPRRSVMFALAAGSLAAACSSSSNPSTPDAGKRDGGPEGDATASGDAQLLNGLLADEYSALQAYADAAPYLEKPDKAAMRCPR
jgi:hypothetical protein